MEPFDASCAEVSFVREQQSPFVEELRSVHERVVEIEDHEHAPASVSTLGKPTTPAMAVGLADHVWTCEEIAALLD
jgi:hypothetical protein